MIWSDRFSISSETPKFSSPTIKAIGFSFENLFVCKYLGIIYSLERDLNKELRIFMKLNYQKDVEHRSSSLNHSQQPNKLFISIVFSYCKCTLVENSRVHTFGSKINITLFS